MFFPSSPAAIPVHMSQSLPSEVECRCVVENIGDSIQSEIVEVLKRQLDRCGPEQQTCAACPPPHPCPDCPACPLSVLAHSPLDFNTAMLAAFFLGMFSGCSSFGCCVRPLVYPQPRVGLPQMLTTSQMPQCNATVQHAPMMHALEDIGSGGGAPSFPAGVIPPGQGLGATPLRRRTFKQSPSHGG